VAADAIDVFDGRGYGLGQCRAWRLHAWIAWTEGQTATADDAWRRAAGHAQAAGEERELFEILGWRASATVEGPTAVEEAIHVCNEIREQVRGSRVTVAVTLQPLAALHAMQGDFDEARALIREANAILEDAGRMQSAVSHHEALVEMLAGDPAAAEDRLRVGYERLEQMGEKPLLATTAAILAEAACAQGRFDEAEELCLVSEQTAPAEDLWTQVIWRGACARVRARQGRLEEAETLADEAVQLAATTDLLTRHGDALLALADVLRLDGRSSDADAAVQDALELYVRKGNVVSAGRARSSIAATVT
jgi:tetratricopeptide (TPR) repeat protein